jgi:hypothetical protein
MKLARIYPCLCAQTRLGILNGPVARLWLFAEEPLPTKPNVLPNVQTALAGIMQLKAV